MNKDITILIHTFKRPDACERLVRSIKEVCPDIPYIVYDDSENDNGISWGRNYLVSQAKTPYVFICDDDCVFTKDTNLVEMLQIIRERKLDILSCDIEGLCYHGVYETDGDTVHLLRAEGLLDFVINTFIAKRKSLLKYKWDERLKIGEHFAYFYEHQGKMRIMHDYTHSILHCHICAPDYDKYRSRVWDMIYLYMREKGLKRRVDMDGNILEVPDDIQK